MRCREANEGELLLRGNLGAKMSNWILETLTGIWMVDCNRGNEKYGQLNRYGQLNPTRWLTTKRFKDLTWLTQKLERPWGL